MAIRRHKIITRASGLIAIGALTLLMWGAPHGGPKLGDRLQDRSVTQGTNEPGTDYTELAAVKTAASRSMALTSARSATVTVSATLSAASVAAYGKASYWPALYVANKAIIGADPNLVRKGIVLRIPPDPQRLVRAWLASRPRVATTSRSVTVSRPSGSPQAIAQSLLATRGWAGQFGCLNDIIVRESGWRVNAENPSGAYGIPQALPGSKMGAGWETSAYVQLHWMIDDYIPGAYGTPCGAWAFEESHGYY
jgi:hypothetical protein